MSIKTCRFIPGFEPGFLVMDSWRIWSGARPTGGKAAARMQRRANG